MFFYANHHGTVFEFFFSGFVTRVVTLALTRKMSQWLFIRISENDSEWIWNINEEDFSWRFWSFLCELDRTENGISEEKSFERNEWSIFKTLIIPFGVLLFSNCRIPFLLIYFSYLMEHWTDEVYHLFKMHAEQSCSKKIFSSNFHTSFDRKVSGDQDYICLKLFWTFFPTEKSRKLRRREKHIIWHFFIVFEFLKTW